MSVAVQLFAALALILVLARVLGGLAVRLAQPAVVGEIVAGILLGPTLFHGELANMVIQPAIRPELSALANLGVALFMFAVGLEADLTRTGDARAAVSVSVMATVLPLALGAGLGLVVASSRSTPDRTAFVMFFAVSMAVTAFPVLARILIERGLHRGRLGSLALASASLSDVIVWSLLVVVVAAVNPSGGSPWRLVLLVPYLAALVAVRPLLRRLLRQSGQRSSRRLSRDRFVVLFIGMLVSAGFTEFLGLHFIFGAFIFGALIPRDVPSETSAEVVHQAGRLGGLLLPIYFVVAGLQVDLSGIGVGSLVTLMLILLVAVGGKLGGGYLGGRVAGLDNRTALGVGVLMNTRGLTELVILTVGLQLGVLDGSLYTLLVVMAVVTTAMTGPLLEVLKLSDASVHPNSGDSFLPAATESGQSAR
ncbi:cation:proton antiporter [Amycolatopsis alba]|uniref:Cation/H(+) antiporter n=1 Tax=Amycolatopsis alba DSM 44262 TaxID=1125972 RepID=A0A229RSN6_AMYAL|nr:cation:proton antiporter [Amycolatopsis alba]OXM49680.1 cation/H(+) antiporter [Amycolatopsis alba DSM 44262]